MKKILKLILLFMAMVGAYIGIQFLNNGGGIIIGPDNGTSSFKKLSDLQFQEWASVPQWDKTKFDNHISEVKKKFELGNLTEYQHNQLIGNICTYAINKTDSVLCAEWKNPNCKPEYIKNQYQGVVEVEKYLKGDARVNKLKRIKKNYDSIYRIIKTLKLPTMGAKAEVNEDYSWTSFEETVKKVKGDINQFVADHKNDYGKKHEDYINYFCNITEIKKALTDDNVKNCINKAADEYYKNIVIELKKNFDKEWNAAIDQKDSTMLNDIYNKMTDSNIINSLYQQCEAYASKRSEDYNDFVNPKEDEKNKLIESWKENKDLEVSPTFLLR